MLEGEPNVELARSHGIAALTMQGSKWSHHEIQMMAETLQATGKNIVLVKLRDNDDTGVKKGTEVRLVCNHIQFPCLVVDPVAICPDIPDKGDIREILENMDIEEFIRRLEAEIHGAATEEIQENPLLSRPHTCEDVVYFSSISNTDDDIPDTAPVSEENNDSVVSTNIVDIVDKAVSSSLDPVMERMATIEERLGKLSA